MIYNLLLDDYTMEVFILGIILVLIIIGFTEILTAKDNIKEIKEKGGIRGYYPNTIKFIMLSYPNTVVTKDQTKLMEIVSEDIDNDVKMIFTLNIKLSSKALFVTGRIIPGNVKWAWVPSKKYKWRIDSSDYEAHVIEHIKEKMVFDPNIS